MKAQIDLFLWGMHQSAPEWSAGDVVVLPLTHQAETDINYFVAKSKADFLLFWSAKLPLPRVELLSELMNKGVDLVHAGLRQGLHTLWPDLCLVLQDWTMIAGPSELPSNSWRVTPEACLLRREMLVKVGGWDKAFLSPYAATLELGYRSLRLGAIVEYQPGLLAQAFAPNLIAPTLQDFYLFLLRHFGRHWTRYVWMRRGFRRLDWLTEWRAWQKAEKAQNKVTTPLKHAHPVWYELAVPTFDTLSQPPVSVIIPTLGRYPYLPQALNSLRQQSVRPREVIVVDQNPPEQRQPEIYLGYEDISLQVIWQDEQGQSLARNTGLAMATSPYVLLFDDDSIADPDLIAAHLRLVLNGRCHVSTGVAFPPLPSSYELPPSYRYIRLAQTFDTGNSLIPLHLARSLGGLDRNYDFGPGTDNDFGTRLYLAGFRIVHNPQARRIHFKAPIGGLRTHGAHKYNTDAGLLQPFPPKTLSYYGLRYLTSQQQWERTLISFITSKIHPTARVKQSSLWSRLPASVSLGLGLVVLPWKWRKSLRQAQMLIDKGACLAVFPVSKKINE